MSQTYTTAAPQKIAFYIGNITLSGGTERSCIAVANQLAQRNNQLEVYLFSTNPEGTKPAFDIHPAVRIVFLNQPSGAKNAPGLIRKIVKAIRQHQINIIVAVEMMAMIFILPAVLWAAFRRFRPKLIAWEHFNFTVDLGRKLRVKCRSWAAHRADGIVVLTSRDKDLWENALRPKAKIVPIGNPSPFPITSKEYQAHSGNIIAIGRLTYQKGFDLLIALWAKYLQQHPELHPKWKLQIIGSGQDEQKLKDQIQKEGLGDRVEMISNTPNVAEYYERAAFLAMTSRFEGLPMTLIEAQSYGLPILAYDCNTGPAEVLSPQSGILVPLYEEDQFITSLDEMIHNEPMRVQMSHSAKNQALRFNPQNVATAWEQLIEDL